MRKNGGEAEDPAEDAKRHLDEAVTEFERSARLLKTFIYTDSPDLVEKHYADLRAAQIRVRAAIEAYRDHWVKSA